MNAHPRGCVCACPFDALLHVGACAHACIQCVLRAHARTDTHVCTHVHARTHTCCTRPQVVGGEEADPSAKFKHQLDRLQAELLESTQVVGKERC